MYSTTRRRRRWYPHDDRYRAGVVGVAERMLDTSFDDHDIAGFDGMGLLTKEHRTSTFEKENHEIVIEMPMPLLCANNAHELHRHVG
jgi:hypothetical protein